MRRVSLTFLCCCIYFLVATGQAQVGPTWTEIAPIGLYPYFSQSQSGVYDEPSDRLIIFGGADAYGGKESDETWVLVNATGLEGTPTWQQLSPLAPNGLPPYRQHHSAVYDPATNRMIIFGGGEYNGYDFNLLNDVWVLTHANGLGGTPQWIPLTPTGGPPAAREGQGAFYKRDTNEMFVFAGGDNGIMSVPNDLWVLEHANGLGGSPAWVQLRQRGDVPNRIEHFALAYDFHSNRMTIAGGCCGYTNASSVLDFDDPSGVPTWTSLSPSGKLPPAGDELLYGYDPVSNALIVYGISPGNATWLLSDANALGGSLHWKNIIPEGDPGSPPEGANLAGGAYNVRHRRFVLPLSIDVQGTLTSEIWVLVRN
jgi:hypothetical protein